MAKFDKKKWRATLALSGETRKGISDKLGISSSTLYRKVKEPKSFTYDEIMKLIDIFGEDEVLNVFFAKEVQIATQIYNETQH